MTVVAFFGNALTAFGPACALFMITIAPSAQLVLLIFASAFAWLMAMLTASIVWFIIPPLKQVYAFHIFTSVLFQEISRWLLYRLFSKAEPGLNIASTKPDNPMNFRWHAFANGFGFGIAGGLMMYVTPLTLSAEPANYYWQQSCGSVSALYFLSWMTSIFIFLNIVWMMIAFDGYSQKSWVKIAWVIIGHYVCSFSTMFNTSSLPGSCSASLIIPLSYLLLSFYFFLNVKSLQSPPVKPS